MRGCLLLIFIMYSCATTLSQEFSYCHYDGKDGLAGSVVYCAAEDKEGFLWFGTETGLSRFDGTAFHNFTTADGLPDNEVLKLFVDSRNRIWMISFSSSVCYYYKGRIYNAENDPVLRQLSFSSDAYAIVEDKFGNIIILEAKAINIISPSGKVRKITTIDDVHPVYSQGGGLSRDSVFRFFGVTNGRMNIYSLAHPENGAPVMAKETAFLGMVMGNSVNTTLISPNLDVSRQKNELFFLPANGKAFVIPLPKNIVSISKIDDSLFAMNSTEGTIVCPDVSVAGTTHEIHDAAALIRQVKPQLVFLDIEMPHTNGFDILDKFRPLAFEVIFVTAFNEYTLKAFRYNVLDYLLKPVSIEELQEAVQKAVGNIRLKNFNTQLDDLLQSVKKPAWPLQKIALTDKNGAVFISVPDIVRCEASGDTLLL